MTPLVSELADRAETCTGTFQLAAGRYARVLRHPGDRG